VPKFRKSVVPLGTHHAPDGSITVTPQRVRSWIDKGQRMLADGIKIPVPWGHRKKANPIDATFHDEEAAAFLRSRFNAGFVEGFERDDDGGLAVVMDVPGAELDEKGNIVTMAELPDGIKVKTSIAEVSAAIDNWTDGKGRKWDDSVMHVALTPLAVVADQKPFELVPDGEAPQRQVRLSLSTLVPRTLATEENPMADDKPAEETPTEPATEPAAATETKPDLLKSVKEALARCGIKVPDETSAEDFLEHLDIALQAYEHAKEHGESEEQAEADANEQVQTPAAAGTPVVEEQHGITMSTIATSKDPLVKALWEDKSNSVRTKRLERIAKLRERGLHKQRADEMEKKAARIELSLLPDGKVAPHPLDEQIKLLEEVLPQAQYTRTSLATDATEQPQPDMTGTLSEERAEELADGLGGRIGQRKKK
jgi:hypothetical protein